MMGVITFENIEDAARIVYGTSPVSVITPWDQASHERREPFIRAAVQAMNVLIKSGETEYQVTDGEGDAWAWSDDIDEALHYLAQEPGGRLEVRSVLNWAPIKSGGVEDKLCWCSRCDQPLWVALDGGSTCACGVVHTVK
jgi:hypothetical protein